MDTGFFTNILFSAATPLLPGSTAMWWILHAGWAVVLGSGVVLITGKLAASYRRILALSVVLWTLLPGAVSPAYWLGLAFQSPSLMSLAICLGWLWHAARNRPGRSDGMVESDRRALKILAGLGIATGWLLLLDTLAYLPLPLYALGFGATAFAAVLAIAAVLWLLSGSPASALPLLVLTLFVLSRLPTGNLWDALLDPWLWLALQLGWLLSAVRRLWQARRSSAATRV